MTQNKPKTQLVDTLAGNNTQEVIRLTNDAMAPYLICGDVLFLRRRNSSDCIVWGMPYVIILNNKAIYIRRIHPYKYGYYSLVSENVEKYPTKTIETIHVKAIMSIVKVERYITERIELI